MASSVVRLFQEFPLEKDEKDEANRQEYDGSQRADSFKAGEWSVKGPISSWVMQRVGLKGTS
jgi:hypothetical protein